MWSGVGLKNCIAEMNTAIFGSSWEILKQLLGRSCCYLRASIFVLNETDVRTGSSLVYVSLYELLVTYSVFSVGIVLEPMSIVALYTLVC